MVDGSRFVQPTDHLWARRQHHDLQL